MARSVALAACRATDPVATARLYVANYDRIVNVMARSTRSAPGAWRIKPSVLIIRSPGQGGFIARSGQRMVDSQRMVDVDTANGKI